MDYIILRIQIRRMREARRRAELYNSRLRKRQLRDASDPFATPEKEFIQYFRLPKMLVRNLVLEVEPHLPVPERSTAIPAHIKVLCALQFFAHGSFQKPIGKDFDLAISQPSVSRCIEEVVNAMNQHLLRQHVLFPSTQAERRQIIQKNFRYSPFQGVLGYVDGTHVTLKAPAVREDLFVNRKGTHSLNVQITCDSDLIILNVLARFPGGADDAYIWGTSNLRSEMERIFRGGEKCWLLGDSGYPTEPWLHVPLPDAPPNTPEREYTDIHCKARNAVERCIGVLKGRFLCLSKMRILNYQPVKVGRIVNACTILHNICVQSGLPDPDEVRDDEDDGAIHDNDSDNDDDDDDDNGGGRRNRRQNTLLTEGERVRYQYLIRPLICNRPE